MKKKLYRTPSITIFDLCIEGVLQAAMSGGNDNGHGTTEVKRYKPIIIDDEEDEEWEETTTAFSGRVFK